MRLYDVNGRLTNKNVSKYLVKWDSPCRSIVQFKVKQFLKQFWRTQMVYEEFSVFGSLLKVDLLNLTLKIAVETNGFFHERYEGSEFFHKNNPANYLKSLKNDHKKSLWLEKNGIQLVEIMEDEVPILSCEFFKDKFNIIL